MISEVAPAKVNVYLHVGPVRRDGLHDLASLIVFAETGDVVSVEPADDLSLRIDGPFAGPLQDEEPHRNLVWRAAEALRSYMLRAGATGRLGARLHLSKRLPIAAGVGGGSADAAAALRALVRLWNVDIDRRRLARIAFALGADVPACLERRPVLVTGAGETVRPLAAARTAPMWMCLVNPRVATPTGPVFRAFDRDNPRPPPPRVVAPVGARALSSPTRWAALAAATRNDLEPAARAAAPVVAEVLDALRKAPGALAARMSGSGATCFALFASAAAARRAASRAAGRGWWAAAARVAA